MIIDRTWNKRERKMIVSYLDKNGNRAFYTKYFHHFATYENDPNGKELTWEDKPCTKVFKDTATYTPNEFDVLEWIYQLPEDIKSEITAMRFPRVYFSDIETEIADEFPDPELAEQRIQLISLVGPDLSVMILGIKPLTDEQKEELKERYLKYIDDCEFARNLVKQKKFEPKVYYQYFQTEEAMLEHWYTRIMPKIGCLAGWNYYRFDWQYMWNRIVKLFGKFKAQQLMKAASPVGEMAKISWSEMDGTKYSIPAPQHCMIWDYMELIKKYEFSLRPYESYSLDWVGSHSVNAHKVKYKGTMKECYENDYPLFVYYNGVDSCLNALIHYRFKCVESPCASGAVTNVPAMKAMGQVALTTANLFYEFYMDNKHVVYDYDGIDRHKIPYEGAFCGAVPGRHEYCVCDDFASLYPSQIITCNLSPESIVKNLVGPDSLGRYTEIEWTEEELDKFRKDPNYFVSVMGTVYKNDKQYAFPRLQARQKRLRNKHKYIGWKLDAQLLTEIDRLIKEKSENNDELI